MKNYILRGGGGYYNTISTLFYKYNRNADTLSTNYYGDTTYYGMTQKMIVSTTQKDKILLIGGSDSTCGVGHQGLYKIMIREVDTNGVLYRTKLFLSNCKYRNVTAVDTAENKGYLIGYSTIVGTWGFEARVMKLDSSLNMLWDKKMTETMSGYMGLVNYDDVSFYNGSTTTDSIWNFTYRSGRPALTKFDENGNIIWQKYYGTKQEDIGVTGLAKCQNGDLIMSGARKINYGELQGFIIRTDSAGNLKWWRDYRPDTSPVLDTLAENDLFDIMELSNGDIAAVGWAGGTSISPLQQTWLLKVDSNGCFGAGNCNVNIATSVNELKEENSFSVFPNPVSQMLNVQLSMFNDKTEIKITDVLGKTIIQQINITQQKTEIDVSSLSKGIYFLSLYQNNRLIGTKKIIKE